MLERLSNGTLISGLVLCASVAPAAAIGATWRRVVRAERTRRDPRQVDAIVVLGAQAFPDRPSRELQARLDHAAELWRAGVAPRVVCSGGWDGAVCEPVVMARALLRAGLPAPAVEVDDRGSCTHRTVATAAEYARAETERVLLVSSPYHLYRLAHEARSIGLSAALSAPPSTPISRHSLYGTWQRAREVVAVWRAWARPLATRASRS